MSDTTIPADAVAWELLAFSFRYPTDELAQAVASGEWVAAAAEIAEALNLEMPKGWLDEMSLDGGATGTDVLLHEMKAEATRLFIGSVEAVCSPYESIWRAKADGVPGLLFVSPYAMEVERICKACGLGRPQGTNEPLDHIATECELMQFLSISAAASLSRGAALAPDRAQALADAFLDEHLLKWAGDFAAAVALNMRLPFYRACASLLAAQLRASKTALREAHA